MKRLEEVYLEEYGKIPSSLSYVESAIERIELYNYWDRFKVTFSKVRTYDLLILLDSIRRDKSKISDCGDRAIEPTKKMIKIIKSLKKELATREHIPNKSERNKTRKEKQINKQNK